jgi:hypothetical protein
MNGEAENPAAMALVNTIKQRVESRYRRILFVHQELAKLNAAADGKLPKNSFEDFVFSHIDFSIYKKIDAEEFTLLFDKGLDDYTEAFYQKAFAMNREAIRAIINSAYIRVGPFYVSKKTSPLLLSIMRTLHTSLEFAPLLGVDDVSGVEQISLAASLLNGIQVPHSDNSETRLFVPEKPAAPGAVPGAAATEAASDIPASAPTPLLCGTFYPLGKAYTITLIPFIE